MVAVHGPDTGHRSLGNRAVTLLRLTFVRHNIHLAMKIDGCPLRHMSVKRDTQVPQREIRSDNSLLVPSLFSLPEWRYP